MRLLNVDTFGLEEFFYSTPPAYAILSHTWGSDAEEVSYRDVQDGRLNSSATRPAKITGCCTVAKADGYQYIWVDTCCIDKTNSVELQEAINSMFRWYQQADICYAYLRDVPPGSDPRGATSSFSSSRWFQRGWTLQELVAPLNLRFYRVDWTVLGTKGSLSDVVEEITGIPTQFLLGMAYLSQASVAQRMSWAANRVTKRTEDIAYCLLGIFGVSMPMIYGEGDRAFRRLQEQVMKEVGDDSILAWGLQPEPNGPTPDEPADDSLGTALFTAGALAPSPSSFDNSSRVVVLDDSRHPSSLELQGGNLRLSLPLLTRGPTSTLASLRCGLQDEEGNLRPIELPLVPAPGAGEHTYLRAGSPQAGSAVESIPPPTLIRLQVDDRRSEPSQVGQRKYWVHVQNPLPELELIDVWPRPCWYKERSLVEVTSDSTGKAQSLLLRFRQAKGEGDDFIAAINPNGAGVCGLMIVPPPISLEVIVRGGRTWFGAISGVLAAKSSSLCLGVKLEPRRSSASKQGFALKLHRSDTTPGTTVNPVNKILAHELGEFMNYLNQVEAEQTRTVKDLEAQLKAKNQKLASETAELDHIRQEIARLQARERRLSEMLIQGKMLERPLATQLGQAKQEASSTHLDHLRVTELLRDCTNTNDLGAKGQGQHFERSKSLFKMAIEHSHEKFARFLLELTNRVVLTEQPSVLHDAVRHGNEKMLKFLLDNGAPINHPDRSGNTALYLADKRGFSNITSILLEKGASTNPPGKARQTLATESGHFSPVRLVEEDTDAFVRPSRLASPRVRQKYRPIHN